MNEWSFEVVDLKEVLVRIQMPIRMPALESEPEPDLAWVRRASAGAKPPSPADVLLLIEVAGTSLSKERGPKLAAYAEAGIPDYWIVDLKEKQIEIFRSPQGHTYAQSHIVCGDEKVSPIALPTAQLTATRLFTTSES